MTRADQLAAEAASAVKTWPSLHSRTARIHPLADGSAEVTLAGIDRRFNNVFAAVREVEALGLTAEVARFDPTSHVLVESPAMRVI